MAKKYSTRNKAVIGYTGFVGGNINSQGDFTHRFNSRNIHDIGKTEFDLVVCAAPSAVKWQANQFPAEDLDKIELLIKDLKKIKTNKYIHISTVDVYKNPRDVDETSVIETEGLHPYGAHRFMLEEFIRQNFTDHLIVRLPGLFGSGLKKNFIFDLQHHNALDFTHKDSEFQYYYLKNIWQDIKIALAAGLNLINFNSEPVSCHELAKECFKLDFNNVTANPAVKYDVKTKYAGLFKGRNGYKATKKQIMAQIKDYLKENK